MRGRAVILKKRTPSSQIRQKTASYDYSHPEMGGFFFMSLQCNYMHV